MKKPVRRATPKKRIAIDDLSGNRELFRLITENVSDLIAVLDRDGRRIYNNPSYRNTLGEPESLLGTNSFIEIHPDDRERIKKIFQETLRSGIGQKAEFRFLRNDVTIRYVESQGNVIKDRDGNITNVVVVSRDITDRKEREHQLSLLAHALTCTRDCFFIIDINETILFVNKSLCDTYGYSDEELHGKNVSLFISPNNSSETLKQIFTTTLQSSWSGEIITRRRNGEDFPIELQTSPLIDNGGEAVGYVGVAREITDRKRSEKIQSAIYRISEAANTTDDLQDLYKSIHAIISDLMPANNFYIALYDEQKDLLHFPYFIDEIDPPYPPKKLGKGLTEYVLRTGEPLLATPDIFNRLVESKHVESIGAPSIDWLGVPLKTKVKTIGVLVVQTYIEGIRYRETEKNILTFVAAQIAMAIERKRIESELRVSEQKLRTIVEHSTNLFYSHTTDHVLTYVSPQTRQFFDCEPEEALIRWTEFATEHPDNAEGYVLTQRAIDSGLPQRPYELELVGKKGRKIWVEVHESPVVSDGKTTAIVGSLTDITEWKKAEKALQLQTFYFRQLFENSPSAIVMLDKTNVILDVNSAFQQIFQYTIDEAKGRYIDDLIVPEFLREEGNQLSETSLSGRIIQKETVRKRKDNSLVDVSVTGYPMMLDNKLIGIYGIYVDITEKKRLEEHLRQAQKMESLGTIAGGIAHDFNNILNIILGHISLLHSGTVPPEKIKQSLETIYKAAQRGSGLVKQILTFARKTDVQIETLEINKIVEELGHLIQETFPKTITLITELDENLPLITADHTQLHLALINLCVNARDAMPQGGSLKVTTSIVAGDSIRKRFHDAKEDQYIRISVTDTGTGIDEATLDRIFEPFFTTKDIGKGTGLGLSVVYGIVEGHRGHIDVKSVIGKGTTFELFFPIPSEPLQLPTAQEQEEKKDTRGTETILIVEDEEMLRDLLKGIIEDRGYRVLVATDGEEAVEIFKTNHKEIALVLSDMGLPKLGGWEVYQKMKEINPRVKSILASGYFDPKLKEEILKAGAKDFLQKPYQPDQILQRIRTVIDEE